MAVKPSVPEIITVNSEDLQTQIRDLLPSQNGFGSELQATNVITPIIDLTSAAEGSTLPQNLQTALSFGSQTSFSVSNASTVVANVPGFYRILLCYTLEAASSGDISALIELTDGSTTKTVWEARMVGGTGLDFAVGETIDLVVFLGAGESASVVSDSTRSKANGSIRQIADSTGTLIMQNGYPL